MEKKKIEKLIAPYVDNHSGCGGASYEETIDKINEIIDVLNGEEEPELAESEDERIRMWLIDCVKATHDCYFETVTREQVLAYLEKQKDSVSNAKYIQDVAHAFEDGRKKGQEEKQKEQKCLPGFDDMAPEEKMNHPLYLEGFDAGRKVGNVEAEQKPAEWSEKQMNIIKDVLSYLNDEYGFRSTVDEMKFRQGLARRLKSLRPSWKPSEHQMNILKAVKEYVGRGSGYWGEGLGSLIEDLEKLM